MSDKQIDFTKPVRTKGSHSPVHIMFTNGRGKYPVRGYIGKDEALSSWDEDGVYITDEINPQDLENIPEPPKTYTLIVYRYSDGSVMAYPVKTPLIQGEIIARVEVTEGEGL